MKRGVTGRYETTAVGGERVEAFVPAPLPPKPPLDLTGPLQALQERASLALGRLDSLSSLLPDPSLFLYAYVRKEAVLSSQIEGTQSSLSDLLLFELDEAPGVPLDDVVEVSNYVAALDHGLARLRERVPALEPADSRDPRRAAVARPRQRQGPGRVPPLAELDRRQPAGQRPFVPPPHTSVPECMAALERFLHETDDGLPLLVRAGLAHVQFETIHPFLDGNGRVGRLLITFLSVPRRRAARAAALPEPLLQAAPRRPTTSCWTRSAATGDWEAWLGFFLEGVSETAEGAVTTARRLSAMFAADRREIEPPAAVPVRRCGCTTRSRRARSSPSLKEVARATGLSFPTAASAMELLVELGIARELTGQAPEPAVRVRPLPRHPQRGDGSAMSPEISERSFEEAIESGKTTGPTVRQ